MLTYRWLEKDEIENLRPIFDEHGGVLPRPELGTLFGALDEDGQVVAFQTIQYVPHAEPRWASPEFRGKVEWSKMQAGIESLFDPDAKGQYYVLVPNDKIANLCKRGGMEELPMRVFRKTVGK